MCVWVWKCAFHLSVCVCVGGNKSKAPEPLDWRGFITVTTQTTSTGSIVLLAGYLTEGGGYGPGVFYLPATNKLTLLVLLSFTVVVGAINKISHKPRSGNGSISQALNSTTPPSLDSLLRGDCQAVSYQDVPTNLPSIRLLTITVLRNSAGAPYFH